MMQSIYKSRILDLLEFAVERTQLAIERTKGMTDYHEFLFSPTGMDKFDATCMRLQSIGETMKKIDTMTQGRLLIQYNNIPWRSVFGLRNIISHEYAVVDPEEIFNVTINHLPLLLAAVSDMIADIQMGEQDELFDEGVAVR